MLNSIKGLIQSKKAYMEAAQLIMEDTEIDDSIVLDETPVAKTEEIEKIQEEEPVQKPVEVPEETPASTADDAETAAEEKPEGTPAGTAEETPASEETPLQVPGTEELPAPAAAPTGEPVSDDSVNIMTAEIDLTTNTQTDVLPVPPVNAADAVEDEDLMNQVIDSGFDQEQPPIQDTQGVMTDPVDEPQQAAPVENPVESSLVEEKATPEVTEACKNCDEQKIEEKCESKEEEVKKESTEDDLLTEAISLGDEPVEGGEESSTDETSTEDSGEKAPDENKENDVTSAVKDKVEEITSDDNTEPEDGGTVNGNDLLMKKLSSLTKSIEDAKALVLKGMR